MTVTLTATEDRQISWEMVTLTTKWDDRVQGSQGRIMLLMTA